MIRALVRKPWRQRTRSGRSLAPAIATEYTKISICSRAPKCKAWSNLSWPVIFFFLLSMDRVAIDGGLFQALSPAKISVLEEGGGLSLWVFGVLVTLKVLANETTASSYALFEDLVPPGAGPPLHIHTREDESWYVLDGELTWTIGVERFHAKRGSFAHLPRLVPHTFANELDKPARMLVTYAPGGFEQWFLDVGTAASSGSGLEMSPPLETIEERKRGVELMKAYGILFPNVPSQS
ncbi:uncharacterized protein LOC112342551 [Selaginella moellendorffii]|uniref:uncharacterized protein LOC112342551 n=1 Tax=Selaginella moellendorffii TaxID=88036 RepID=UPI000D1C6C59|nr:uncharacterized protein LOC112342551 [Selaginella moellendorffii]|eukprot:XP_024520340.1 uncharacterized protein LOC112342551 [Selaginella moellendorffii]